jgi:hypothetical protein
MKRQLFDGSAKVWHRLSTMLALLEEAPVASGIERSATIPLDMGTKDGLCQVRQFLRQLLP